MGKPVLYYYDGKRGEAEAIRMMFKEMGEVRHPASKASYTPYLAPLDGRDHQRPACQCQFPPTHPRTGIALPTTTSTVQLTTHQKLLACISCRAKHRPDLLGRLERQPTVAGTSATP